MERESYKSTFSPSAEFLKSGRASEIRKSATGSYVVVEVNVYVFSLYVSYVERVIVHLVHHDELLIELWKRGELATKVPIVKVSSELSTYLSMTCLILGVPGCISENLFVGFCTCCVDFLIENLLFAEIRKLRECSICP